MFGRKDPAGDETFLRLDATNGPLTGALGIDALGLFSGDFPFLAVSGITDAAIAEGFVFDTVDDLATDGATVLSVFNVGSHLFHVEKAGAVVEGRLSVNDTGVLDPFSALKLSGTFQVLNVTPQGTGVLDIATTMNMIGSIKSVAAFNAKATVIGTAALPFVSGMLFEVEQQGNGSWGANVGAWQQQPVVVGARWSARTGSISMGNYGSVFTAFPPDFDPGTGFSPLSTYVGFDARPGQSGVQFLKGMNVEPQINNTGDAIGLSIGQSSGLTGSVGLWLDGDGIGADVVFGSLQTSGIYDSGTDLIFDADLQSLGGRSFIFQNGPLNISALDLITDTTTGTKIGTAAGQKIGFWNAAPVIQPVVTGSRAGGAALVSLLTQLATAGLIVDNTVA